MKIRIRACVAVALALCLSTAVRAAPPADGDRITQLLDQLGVNALLEQAPTVLAAAAEAESRPHGAKTRSAAWRDRLAKQLQPQRLSERVARYLSAHGSAAVFRQAESRLQQPLAKRVRYFDLAMMQTGAATGLRVFLKQSGLEQHSLEQYSPEQNGSAPTTAAAGDDDAVPDTVARRALLRQIDTATASSLLTATLQSAVAARVRQAAGRGSVDAAVLRAQITTRARYLAPLSTDYLLYDYRYLSLDELREFRDLMRDKAVQTLLDLSRKGLLEAIAGESTQPPAPPR